MFFVDLFNYKGGLDGVYFNVVGCDDVDVDVLMLVMC